MFYHCTYNHYNHTYLPKVDLAEVDLPLLERKFDTQVNSGGGNIHNFIHLYELYNQDNQSLRISGYC